mgnify:CR=1 FL=1
MIYGGTSAAISAAVQVKKMGKSVVVVSPDAHLGGLSSSGLGWTDSGRKEAIGGIARDFNNLLTAMIGFCDLLLQRYRPGEQAFAGVMQIKQNANRGASLVRQFLAFANKH